MKPYTTSSSHKLREELRAQLNDAQKQILSCRKRVAELREKLALARLARLGHRPPTPQNERTDPMTPAQLEHLKLIDAHLERLLAIAEKRTPGKWMKSCFNVFTDSEEARLGVDGHHIADCDPANDKSASNAQSDAAFIASCAGNAEAGWRATRAAIASAMQLQTVSLSPCNGGSCMVATDAEDVLEGVVNAFIQSILAAFPLESLKIP